MSPFKQSLCANFLILLSLAIFVAGTIVKLNMPMLEWDSVSLEAAKAWAAGQLRPWVFDHPPLYPLYLVLPFRFLGAAPETARIFNMFPVLAAAGLVYLTATHLSGRLSGIIGAFLYLINPVTIQGIQSLDSSDTTLLPLCFTLILYALVVHKDGGKWEREFMLSVLFALSLWAKVTSTLAFIAGGVFYLLFFQEKMDKALRSTIVSGVSGGLVLFIVTWSSASLFLWGTESWATVLATPFRYFYPAFPSSGTNLFLKWSLNLVRIVFWFSPFLLYLAFVSIWDVFKQGVTSGVLHFLAFLCIFYFAGHIFIGGSNYGFPRYHAAISPLIHIFAGIALARMAGWFTVAQRWKLIIPVFLFSSLAVVYADPGLLINLELKQLFVFEDYNEMFIRIFGFLFVFAALPFAAGAFCNRIFGLKYSEIVAVAATAALLGSCVFLDLKQGLAEYSTAYQYGAREKNSVLEQVSGKLSGGETVMTTPEFLYDLRFSNVFGPRWSVWQSEKDIYNFVAAREPAFIIAGWTTHTKTQLGYLLKDKKMKGLLEEKYVLFKIGTYFVWESRHGKSPRRTVDGLNRFKTSIE